MIDRFCSTALNDLQRHKNHTKDEILTDCVLERLNKSFSVYDKELSQSLDYLKRRNELNVVRKLNRLR